MKSLKWLLVNSKCNKIYQTSLHIEKTNTRSWLSRNSYMTKAQIKTIFKITFTWIKWMRISWNKVNELTFGCLSSVNYLLNQFTSYSLFQFVVLKLLRRRRLTMFSEFHILTRFIRHKMPIFSTISCTIQFKNTLLIDYYVHLCIYNW